jgi:ADP-ribose pyrophosphatase YjhB (NUDIX family)
MISPDVPILEKVGACIVRRNREGLYELLLFRHADMPAVPAQIPGGTVETGHETIEQAVHREVLEETGLANLKLIRKIADWEWLWSDMGIMVHRHCFLLEAPQDTPDEWIHVVSGTGSDAEMRFACFWFRPTPEFQLGGGFDIYLTERHLPELYGQD